jgi:alkanesulfonate monooxygenase SsuD/methylene tetrahydromethanopterin reductase-like flavin-dependent oxidoreductase (luciferase family)
MVNRLTVVAEDETAARQAARPHAGAVLQNYARAGALGSDPALRSAEPAALFEQFDRDWCFVGTPEQVVSRIQRYAEAGVSHIQARVCPGDMPAELVARTLELMGKAVLPEFR